MNFCMASTQSRKENEGKERKKRKAIWVKPHWITIHVPPREEKDTETNQIVCWNYGSNCWSKLHALSECGGVIDACKANVNNFFFIFLCKKKIPHD
jgi:hypothetical protein